MPTSRAKMRKLYNFGGEYIYANFAISSENQSVCNLMAIDLIRSSIRINNFVLLSMLLAIGAPLYKIIALDEHEMIIPVIIPFIDPESEFGFYVNLANQLFNGVFGLIIIPGCELFTCVIKNNISATAAMIKNVLAELGIALESKCEPINDWQFQNLILKTMDFDRF